MTLTRLLEIESRLLSRAARSSMEIAQQVWAEHGRPVDGPSLIEVLEEAMQTCQQGGVRYPPILLKRKKELQRGEWSPPELEEGICLECDGRGFVSDGRTYTMCRCQSESIMRGYTERRAQIN